MSKLGMHEGVQSAPDLFGLPKYKDLPTFHPKAFEFSSVGADVCVVGYIRSGSVLTPGYRAFIRYEDMLYASVMAQRAALSVLRIDGPIH